jgi:putative FmdB family regulatory protein
MPLYEYACDACGHRFEVIQKFSDALVDVCPKCGAPVRKLISSPAIQFKGSGFYITDYAKRDQPGSGVPSEASKNGAGATADAKGDKGEKAENKEKTTSADTSTSKATPASSTPAAGKDS